MLIKENLRDIMRTEDLDNLTSKMVRTWADEEVGTSVAGLQKRIRQILNTRMFCKPALMFALLRCR